MDFVRVSVKNLVAGLLFNNIVIFFLRKSRLKGPKNPKEMVTLRIKNENKSAGPGFSYCREVSPDCFACRWNQSVCRHI